MKTKFICLLGLLLPLLSACSGDDEEQTVVAVTSIAISPANISLEQGTTRQLTATVTPQNATDRSVTWSSSDNSVATVSTDGTVTGVSKGTATIIATAGGKTATCQATVTFEVQSVSVSPATVTLSALGETFQLTATVLPEGSGEAVWSSSDESVVTVSAVGLVTAVSAGTAVITATAGEKSAACEVTVSLSVVDIDGIKATVRMDGASVEDVANAIAQAAEAGVTHFTMKGDFASSGFAYKTNPFYGIQAEQIDLTGVTGWPLNDDGVAELPQYAFYSGGEQDLTGIKEVLLPAEVKSIGKQAFYKCTGLTRVDAPGVQTVVLSAFNSCKALAEVNLPEVQTIDQAAFSSTGLAKVSFPKVTFIDGGAFSYCTKLAEVDLPELVTISTITDGTGGSSKSGAFADCLSLTKVSLPKVTEVGDRTFSSCNALTEIELPLATTIGTAAFMNSNALTTVSLPKATTLNRDVFTNCSALAKLNLLAEGSLSVQNTTFGSANTLTKNIDLTLNANKESEVTYDITWGTQWRGHTWKSCSYAQ